MVPPDRTSPHGLIQEGLWPDRWQCTVACVLLNRSGKKQVRSVYPALFERAPTASDTLRVPDSELEELLRPLGMQRRKAETIKRLAACFVAAELSGGVRTVAGMHGIGAYAKDSDRLFFGRGVPADVEDHVLVRYAEWRRTCPWDCIDEEVTRRSETVRGLDWRLPELK